jgi:hypothetical protein
VQGYPSLSSDRQILNLVNNRALKAKVDHLHEGLVVNSFVIFSAIKAHFYDKNKEILLFNLVQHFVECLC